MSTDRGRDRTPMSLFADDLEFYHDKPAR